MTVAASASLFVYTPDLRIQELQRTGVVYVAQQGSDNASNAVTTRSPVAGGITILAVHATYEAAADAGALTINGTVASVRDLGTVFTLVAATASIVQLPSMTFRNADGAVVITLAAGGSLSSFVTVWYVNLQGN